MNSVLKVKNPITNEWVDIPAIVGPQGKQGVQGPQGPQGPQGEKGTDGYTPIKGIDYFDGKDGAVGPQGEKGTSGVYIGTKPPTDGTTNVWINTNESASGSDFVYSPSIASIGQTIVVKAVDENGKPTKWEAADLPSDCGKWQLLKSVDITEEVRVLDFSEPDWCYDEIYIMLKTIPPIESTGKQIVVVRLRDSGGGVSYSLEEALWNDGSTQIDSFVYCFKPYEAELVAGYGVRKGKSMVTGDYNQKVTPNSYINSFQIYANADNFGVGTHIEFWGR